MKKRERRARKKMKVRMKKRERRARKKKREESG